MLNLPDCLLIRQVKCYNFIFAILINELFSWDWLMFLLTIDGFYWPADMFWLLQAANSWFQYVSSVYF